MQEISYWHILDHSVSVAGGNVLDQFATDQELLRGVAAGNLPPVLRLWRHRQALVLGYRDTRLPGWEAAAAQLAGEGYSVGVRPSGGMAVPLDPGVLNISLIYPDPAGQIDQGFRAMHRLLAAGLAALGLQADVGEVAGGYCPGESDLSCGGRKVAGVAQRRTRGGAAVQAFLLIEGEGPARGRVAARFYDLALQGAATGAGPAGASAAAGAGAGSPPGARLVWPRVRPEVMASLQELAGPEVTVGRVARLLARLLQGGGTALLSGPQPPPGGGEQGGP